LRNTRWLLLLVPPLLLAGTSGCGSGRAQKAETEGKKPSSAVVTVQFPQRRTLNKVVEQPGYIRSYENTPIYSRIPGYVLSVGDRKVKGVTMPVDMGDIVEKDQVLATLYVPEMEDELLLKSAMVLQAKAELKQAQEWYKQAVANLETVKAQVTEEEAVRPRVNALFRRWKSEYERVEPLAKKGILDEQTEKELLHQYKSAEGVLGEVEAKIKKAIAARDESAAKKDKAAADVAFAEVRIKVAAATEKYAKSMLDYRQITSPFKGMVVQRNVHTGHLVKPSQGGEGGEPLFTLVRMDVMRIFVDVPETDAVRIQAGHPVIIRIQAHQNREIETTVTRISWAFDMTARTLRAEIDLPNDKLDLRPGMYAYAIIPIAYKDVWTVPATALIQKGEEGAFIYHAEEGNARLTPVRLGVREGGHVQILQYRRVAADPATKSRWTEFAGQENVITNPAGLIDGMAIEISSK
jgi:multidrug efflux pump subunit AcrA (membrane-fusion protein)